MGEGAPYSAGMMPKATTSRLGLGLGLGLGFLRA